MRLKWICWATIDSFVDVPGGNGIDERDVKGRRLLEFYIKCGWK